MNTRNLLTLCIALFLLSSCSKDVEVVNEMDKTVAVNSVAKTSTTTTHSLLCIFDGAEVGIIPFCSADPANFPETNFPISVILNGERIFYEGYSYQWSTGSSNSAISISYNELPVTLTLTEDATGCQVVLTLDQDYWGKGLNASPVSVCDLPTSLNLPEGSGIEKVRGENSGGF